MDFERCFNRTVTNAIQMEASWFYELNKQDNDPSIEMKQRHTMPFLYSNLRYERGIPVDPKATIRLVPRKRRQRLMKVEQQRLMRLTREKKTPDLLFTIFRYRTKDYNQAFLDQPRRQTRGSIKARTRVAATKTPEDAPLGISKQPDNGADTETKVDYDSKDEQGNIVTASQPSEGSLSVQSVGNYTKTMLHALTKQKRSAQPEDFQAKNNKAVKKKKKDADNSVTHAFSLKTKVVLSCLYINPEDGSIAMQSDINVVRGCRRCHLCFFRTKTDEELLMHFRATHGEFLEFSANKCENSTLHIVARKKRGNPEPYPSNLKDFTFIRCPKIKSAQIPPIQFVQRSSSNVVAMDKATRVKKMRILNMVGAPDDTVAQFQPNSEEPVREYFHSRTNEPMVDGEWDVDSDEESDRAWYDKISEDLIDDFEDVTDSEKRFIFMWNKFMKSHTIVPDLAIPKRCLKFIRSHATVMQQYNLRHDLNLHLMGLWDHRLLSQTHLHRLMKEYDRLEFEAAVAKGKGMKMPSHVEEPQLKKRRAEQESRVGGSSHSLSEDNEVAHELVASLSGSGGGGTDSGSIRQGLTHAGSLAEKPFP